MEVLVAVRVVDGADRFFDHRFAAGAQINERVWLPMFVHHVYTFCALGLLHWDVTG